MRRTSSSKEMSGLVPFQKLPKRSPAERRTPVRQMSLLVYRRFCGYQKPQNLLAMSKDAIQGVSNAREWARV